MSSTNGQRNKAAPLGVLQYPNISPTRDFSHGHHIYPYAALPSHGIAQSDLPFSSASYAFYPGAQYAPGSYYPVIPSSGQSSILPTSFDPQGYMEVPVGPAPIHSLVFDGSYPPATTFEYGTADFSLLSYGAHQPLSPTTELSSRQRFAEYSQTTVRNQALFGHNGNSIPLSSSRNTLPFAHYLANQANGTTSRALNAQFQPSAWIQSSDPYGSLSSTYDDSPWAYYSDLSPFLQDRGPLEPNEQLQDVDTVPRVAESTFSPHFDSSTHRISPAASPRRRSTMCHLNLAHAPQQLCRPLKLLLSLIRDSEFFRNHEMEPNVDQARDLLLKVKDQTRVSLGRDARGSDSVYCLFIDRTSNKTWLCGHSQGTLSRAVGHIRSMLDHRPFPCLGRAGGCASRRCNKPGVTVSFFTKAMLDDHMKRSTIKEKCTHEGCHKWIRKGGMSRHRKLHIKSTTILDLM